LVARDHAGWLNCNYLERVIIINEQAENTDNLVVKSRIMMLRLKPLSSGPHQTQWRSYCSMLALALGMSGGSVFAASITAPVSARIVSTVNLLTLRGMQFGEVTGSHMPGTIVLEPGGARTSTQGATLNSAVPGWPASFEIIGDTLSTFIITLPVSVTLSSASGENMEVNQFTSLPSATGQLDGGGRQTLFVGGTLNVNANQLYGNYSGVMSVTVEYN